MLFELPNTYKYCVDMPLKPRKLKMEFSGAQLSKVKDKMWGIWSFIILHRLCKSVTIEDIISMLEFIYHIDFKEVHTS